ncbi:MAG TPA: sugar phosphate isomerase/epimerase [Solirubrobacteraceae bacterium]|nr:sugar phosphate isomerase/epimerase [Solirubrobacteraceae bacterium]
MGEIELVDLYWTSAGPVDVHYGREWSTFDWRERCTHAARVGFRGLGLWHADVAHQLETRTLREMKQIFDDAGLEHLEVEFLADFFLPPGQPARTESDRLRRQLFATAAAFDAHHIKVGNIPGATCEMGRLTDEFAALCQDAAAHTDARIAYEFMPFDVNVNTLDAALTLVTDAAPGNGGLAIDTWHMSKLGIAPDELRRIPARYLTWVELSDGQFQDMADPIDETINHRRLPGDGEFEIPAFVDVCREIGYTGPWGVEVLSAALRGLPIDEQFDRAYEATAAQFRAGVA